MRALVVVLLIKSIEATLFPYPYCPDVSTCIWNCISINEQGCQVCNCTTTLPPCGDVSCPYDCVSINEQGCQVCNCPTTQPPTCEDVSCPDACVSINEQGCPVCNCSTTQPPTCGGEVCPEGKECKEVSSGCENVPPGVTCSPVITKKCMPKCSPVQCAMFCEYGFETGENGCEICKCKQPLCEGEICPSGTECRKVSADCRTPRLSCKKCLPLCPPVCFIFCEYGNVLNRNGCPLCQCLQNPCADKLCGNDSICEVVANRTCHSPDCNPFTGICRSTECRPVLCKKYCKFGFDNDVDGCPICKCRPNPCQYVKCLRNQTCVPQQLINCKNPPCPYIGVCVDKCPLLKCRPCPGGYVIDINGCRTCQCRRYS